MQAIKGIFKTPDGATVANMFTEFGVSQSSVDMDLDVGSTDVNAKISELKRKVKAGLKTSSMTGVDVYPDELTFDKLVSHASIKAYYDMSVPTLRCSVTRLPKIHQVGRDGHV